MSYPSITLLLNSLRLLAYGKAMAIASRIAVVKP